MKIYTRTGDDGSTALFGGARVGKDDARVEAYGTVDEANAALGLARAELARDAAAAAATGGADAKAGFAKLDADLARLQSLLFDLGADLATPGGTRTRAFIQPILPEDVEHLEALIDEYSLELPPLTHFILPGGTPASGAFQLARATIRRAERHAVALARGEEVFHLMDGDKIEPATMTAAARRREDGALAYPAAQAALPLDPDGHGRSWHR